MTLMLLKSSHFSANTKVEGEKDDAGGREYGRGGLLTSPHHSKTVTCDKQPHKRNLVPQCHQRNVEDRGDGAYAGGGMEVVGWSMRVHG